MFFDKSYHQQVLYQHQATAASVIQQQQQHHQQQQKYEAFRDWNLAQSQRNQPHIYPQQWPTSRVQMSSQSRPYSGVEQLLMAAMIEGNYPHHPGNYANSMPQQSHSLQSSQLRSSSTSMQSNLPIVSATQQEDSEDFLPSGRGLAYRPQPHMNFNHNEISIPTPRNNSELGLYRLLESANLLDYFGTFVHYGGDDVQQLSDADEDEFMEIMDLVGMNKKPLHIRRLQRALANWRRNQKDKESDMCEIFKRPRLETHMSNLVDRCSSPCDSRRSNTTSVTIDTSHPATPRSSSTQSFLMVPDEPRESRSNLADDSSSSQELNYQRPHVLINAPKRIRLFNPTQMNRNQCKTT